MVRESGHLRSTAVGVRDRDRCGEDLRGSSERSDESEGDQAGVYWRPTHSSRSTHTRANTTMRAESFMTSLRMRDD